MIPRLDDPPEVSDRENLAERLQQAGLSPSAARRRAELFARAAAMLAAHDSSALPRAAAFYVPGRIEVLGKHTDYAGGRSLVLAADQGFSLVAAPRDDRLVVVLDAVRRAACAFELAPGLAPQTGPWSNYPATVARRVARNFPGAARGATLAFASDLPPAAGMSSSSALLIAVFLALDHVNALADRAEYRENLRDGIELAGYVATIENGQSFGALRGDSGVGTFGGSEDHTAILNGRAGHVSQYSYCPVRFERAISIPPGVTLAVGTSGLVAEKTGAAREKYNSASRLASQLAQLWRRATGGDAPHLAAIVAAAPEAADRFRQLLREASDAVLAEVGSGAPCAAPPALLRKAFERRLEHFLLEDQEILPAAGDALQRGDLQAFGDLVDRSQRGANELLGNQVAETSFLAASARAAGALAASAFGAGFGGSVWAMIESSRAETFLAAWAEAYRSRFPERARASSFSRVEAGPPALRVR